MWHRFDSPTIFIHKFTKLSCILLLFYHLHCQLLTEKVRETDNNPVCWICFPSTHNSQVGAGTEAGSERFHPGVSHCKNPNEFISWHIFISRNLELEGGVKLKTIAMWGRTHVYQRASEFQELTFGSLWLNCPAHVFLVPWCFCLHLHLLCSIAHLVINFAFLSLIYAIHRSVKYIIQAYFVFSPILHNLSSSSAFSPLRLVTGNVHC